MGLHPELQGLHAGKIEGLPMILPTEEEISQWVLTTLRHCCQVEFYLHALDIGHQDPQRPHDIVGLGNKYSWEVIKGLSLTSRNTDPEFFEQCVLPAITYHRTFQFHHQKWNPPAPDATREDMMVGAIDAMCSMLEDRAYQGGKHNFEEIIDIVKINAPHKVKWFWMVYSQMKSNGIPDVERIQSLDRIPNIGLPEKRYGEIVERVQETRVMLDQMGYHI